MQRTLKRLQMEFHKRLRLAKWNSEIAQQKQWRELCIRRTCPGCDCALVVCRCDEKVSVSELQHMLRHMTGTGGTIAEARDVYVGMYSDVSGIHNTNWDDVVRAYEEDR